MREQRVVEVEARPLPRGGSRRPSLWKRAGRPRPARRCSTPGGGFGAPGQMSGGQTAVADSTLKTS